MKAAKINVDTNTFGGRLYEKIIEKFGSRYAFEKATGFSRESVLLYIKNKRNPNIMILAEMCKTLDVSADYLLFGKK